MFKHEKHTNMTRVYAAYIELFILKHHNVYTYMFLMFILYAYVAYILQMLCKMYTISDDVLNNTQFIREARHMGWKCCCLACSRGDCCCCSLNYYRAPHRQCIFIQVSYYYCYYQCYGHKTLRVVVYNTQPPLFIAGISINKYHLVLLSI